MALIKCPECGGKISDKAVWCPHCGAPVEVKDERANPEFTSPIITDEHESVDQSSISNNKKKHKFGKIIIAILAVAVLGGVALKFALDYINKETIKHQLISNTNYVKEHIIGAWVSSIGTVEDIMEFYTNGDKVEYMSIQDSIFEDNTIPSIIHSAFEHYEYSAFEVKDPNSYTDEELQNYGVILDMTDNAVAFLKVYIPGGEEDITYFLCEFLDDDTILMGPLNGYRGTVTRISSGDSKITDDASGLYVCEDAELWLAIIERADTNIGYCSLCNSRDETIIGNGICNIYDNQVAITLPDMDDFIFERDGSNLIEIGSEEFPGSQLTYKKVSNLAYCSPIDVIPNGKTTEEPPVVSDNSDDEPVIEGSWEPAIYPKNPGDDSAIRIYYESYEPADSDIIYCYDGNIMDDWSTNLVFVASEPVTDFRIVNLKMSESLSDDYLYSVGETLFDVGGLLPEQAITASLPFADIPTWGIIYTGSDGRTRAFSVGDNAGGQDIEELEGYAPGVCLWEDVSLETPVD